MNSIQNQQFEGHKCTVGSVGTSGSLHYLNDLNEAIHGTPEGPSGSSLGTMVESGVDSLAPIHSSLNNNNNMVSAGPSPSSSISPLQRFLEIQHGIKD